MSDNPYSTPESMTPAGISREEALARVNVPGILLLITGVLSIFGALTNFGIPTLMPQFLQFVSEAMNEDPNATEEQRQQIEEGIQALDSPLNKAFYFGSGLVSLLGAIVMCIGAVRMRNLQSYGLSMAACICAVCPVVSACCGCIFPIAIGIWGIVVIANQDVKSHFG